MRGAEYDRQTSIKPISNRSGTRYFNPFNHVWFEMQPSQFSKIRLAVLALIAVIMIGHRFLPPKRDILHPSPNNVATIYADEAWGGKTTAIWIDPAAFHWRCTLVQSEFYPVCGLAISFPGEPGQTRDLSGYEAISIRLRYTGEAEKLRIYLRNHNPVYSDLEDVDSLKFNAISLRTADFAKQETVIHLSEFAVADWWLEERDIPRELARPEMKSVAALGIDFPFPQVFGQHDIQIESIELIGSWISPETLYLSIIIIGMLVVAGEALTRLAYLRRRSKADRAKIQHLTDYARSLQQQSDKYKELSIQDPLTGVLNRNGLAPKLNELFGEGKKPTDIALILFDVDHFKRINDHRGHDAGDRVLKEIARLVQQNIRQTETLARWGGEEFIIVAQKASPETAEKMAEKLRTLIAQHRFEPNDPLQVSVSLGVTLVSADESFDDAFKRGDQALYRAKDLGRNCVVIA